jgi:hypothetical protein
MNNEQQHAAFIFLFLFIVVVVVGKRGCLLDWREWVQFLLFCIAAD